MKHSRIQTSLLTVLLFISSISLFGQKLAPKKRNTAPDTTLTSIVMNRDYQLYISFPRGYTNKDTVKYPVLYVLDGLYSFPAFKTIREYLDIDKELDSVIIVGIGSGGDGSLLTDTVWYVNRMYDYTTSEDTADDRKTEKQFNMSIGTVHSGGAQKFLKCITKEIIPYIETHYKTTNDRGITGFSLGGLFTAWCFLNTKGIFNKFGINSPSLWWHNEEIIKQADMMFNTNQTWGIAPTKVFISVGEKEDPIMTSGMEKFSRLLESKAYKNVSVTKQQFLGETHLSAMRPSLKRTIAVLYDKKK